MKESAYEKNGGKISSGRLSSYFILAAIIASSTVFTCIDIVNSIVAISTKGFYEIPGNHVVIYGMILAHHLTLLGINKNSEVKIEEIIRKKIESKEEKKEKDNL